MTIQAKPPSPAPGRWWSARSWPPSSWRPIPQSADGHADTDHRRAAATTGDRMLTSEVGRSCR
jgi:hypothetical protein